MLFKVYFRRFFRVSIFAFASWILIGTNFGLIDYIKFSKEISVLEKTFQLNEKERTRLLKLVKDISQDTIDSSLLEIQVKKVLAYARADEEVYFWK